VCVCVFVNIMQER